MGDLIGLFGSMGGLVGLLMSVGGLRGVHGSILVPWRPFWITGSKYLIVINIIHQSKRICPVFIVR